MTGGNSVRSGTIVSDEKVRDVLRRHIHIAISVEHTFTRETLAVNSGVNVHTIDAITAREPGKNRRVKVADALSIALVLGERAVNSLLALIGYGGATPLDAADAKNPMQTVANAMSQVAVIAGAAADGRIDHTERAAVAEAADLLIAEVIHLSSAGQPS